MGSNTSKPSNETSVHIQKNDLEIDASNSDPRSPTPEIVRTPLQGKAGSKHNITKNADLRKTFENAKGDEKLIHNNPILSAVIKNHLQSYDPRSPTQEFERTPIVIASKIDELTNEKKLLKNQSENNYGSPCLRKDDDECENYDSVEANEISELLVPKNLCNGFMDMTLSETIKESDEPLGSSTASNEAIENDISNNNGISRKFLETNFDYVESGIDYVEASKESNESNDDLDTTSDDIKHIPVFKILGNDPRSPSTGIERTPIVVAKNEIETPENNVEEMSDDTLIKVLQNTNAELRQTLAKPHENPDEVLIYEDESTELNDTPKKSKSTNSGSRTPLSCMKNKSDTGHTRSKSANTLHDPKEQKISRRVSHIPRLKSLSKQTKLNPMGSSISLKNISKASVISGDCENTPPHSHRDRWDKNNSIVL